MEAVEVATTTAHCIIDDQFPFLVNYQLLYLYESDFTIKRNPNGTTGTATLQSKPVGVKYRGTNQPRHQFAVFAPQKRTTLRWEASLLCASQF